MSKVTNISMTNSKVKEEKADDNILFTLKINNISLRSRLEIIGKLTKNEQDQILTILGIK